MTSLILFLGVTLLLILEGTLFSRMILRRRDWWLHVSLALPLAAFSNVLLIVVLTITRIPLSPLSILLPHAILTFALLLGLKRISTFADSERSSQQVHSRFFIGVSSLIIAILGVYAFSHAVLLPSFQYDSATNWTMRSQISFYDGHIAFDETEIRGMAKPQYPFLFHAVQITANQGQTTWNDTAANTILFLLALGTLSALFLMLRKMLSATVSITTLALIFGTPLLAVQMAQGYADSLLIEFILLGFASLLLWVHFKETRWLLLSGVLMAASVWTKSEGLFFGLLPWVLTVSYFGWREKRWNEIMKPAFVSVVLGVSWTIGALLAGLSLTPHHSSDATLAPSTEAMREAFIGLFDRGSFGIHWYAISCALLLCLIGWRKRHAWVHQKFLGTFFMGILTFILIWAIYTLTPNSQFLLKAESYYRQMLIPLGLFILSLAVAIRWDVLFSREASRSKTSTHE